MEKIVRFVTFFTLFCVYIFPTGYLDTSIPIEKMIFSMITIFSYILIIFSSKKIKTRDVLFLGLCIVMFLFTRYINYLLFATILFSYILIDYRHVVINYLKKSHILYFCVFFTLLYSILNFGNSGRYAFSAILEINQSGLAIFLLAIMLFIKNVKCSYFLLLFGLLTFSRSYYLAFGLFVLSKFSFVKKILSHNKIQSILKFLNYKNFTILSSICFILLGLFYLFQYKSGNISLDTSLSSKFRLLDLSNFFRFFTNFALLLMLSSAPQYLLYGISREQYISMGHTIYSQYQVPYKYVNPHNLFFSHLKQYGVFAIVEIVLVSKILSYIVNKNNFMVYLGIVFYSIILGAGLYSYWLFVSIYALLVYDEVTKKGVEI